MDKLIFAGVAEQDGPLAVGSESASIPRTAAHQVEGSPGQRRKYQAIYSNLESVAHAVHGIDERFQKPTVPGFVGEGFP